jgi:hypothetical protein
LSPLLIIFGSTLLKPASKTKSILGKKHAFVKISNKIPTKVEAAGDYVMITVDLEDLKKLLK